MHAKIKYINHGFQRLDIIIKEDGKYRLCETGVARWESAIVSEIIDDDNFICVTTNPLSTEFNSINP